MEKLSANWSIHLGGSAPRELAGGRWESLRQEGTALPPYPDANCLVLTSGDRVLIDSKVPPQIDEDQFSLRAEVGPISVPRAYLSYYCRRVPDGIDEPARFLAGLAKAKREHDVLYLTNGDRIEGVLVTPARGPIYAMKVGERMVATPLEQIAVLVANTQLQARPRPKKAFAHVVTKRGDRLQFSALQLSSQKDRLSGKTLFGARVQLPLEQVALMTMQNGPVVYLSDLTAKSFVSTPFLGVTWPLALDTDVMGRQLALAGNYYDKGLGMHAAGAVTYALKANDRFFEAIVGVGQGPGPPARAKISVSLDGVAALAVTELSAAQPPLTVRIDLHAAHELTLKVDFGERGDVRARVNWANARLLKVDD